MEQDSHITDWCNHKLREIGRLSQTIREAAYLIGLHHLRQSFISRRDKKHWGKI